VLDALDCDVVTVSGDSYTNAFEEPERWHPYDFNGRLPAWVMNPADFVTRADGVIVQGGDKLMGPDAFVFDEPGAGQPLDLTQDAVLFDLAKTEEDFKKLLLTPEKVASVAAYCAKARASMDRAIMFDGLNAGLGFNGGMARFSMLCLTQPEHIHQYHDLITRYMIQNVERLLPAIAKNVDILMVSANDRGIQTGPILPPAVDADVFGPYCRRFNDRVHQIVPHMNFLIRTCFHWK
jgi:hypothetical protein